MRKRRRRAAPALPATPRWPRLPGPGPSRQLSSTLPPPRRLLWPFLSPGGVEPGYSGLPHFLLASCLFIASVCVVKFPLHAGQTGRQREVKQKKTTPALCFSGSLDSFENEKVPRLLSEREGGGEGCPGCGSCRASSGAQVQPGHGAALGSPRPVPEGMESSCSSVPQAESPHSHPAPPKKRVSRMVPL